MIIVGTVKFIEDTNELILVDPHNSKYYDITDIGAGSADVLVNHRVLIEYDDNTYAISRLEILD